MATGRMCSWAPEVLVDGRWCGNALRFATEAEAARSASALLMRWFVPTDSRAVQSQDAVNYTLTADGQLVEFKGHTIVRGTTTSDDAAIGVLMFKDTIVARMLRVLCFERAIPQSKFMNEYTRRCERPPSKWRAAEGKSATRSSFLNQFGRYVEGSTWGRDGKVPRVISQEQMLHPYDDAKVTTLVWLGSDAVVILTAMSDRDLQRAYESMERQLLKPRATDNEAETLAWIQMLITEIGRRTAATMEAA